jgi:putative transposase
VEGGDLATDKRTAHDLGAWIVFADESGPSLRPPTARTWSRRGCTPVVKVTGKGSGRVSLAGLIALKPKARTKMIYRMLVHHGRKGEKKGFGEVDFARLLDAAHQQLRGPIVLIWDNSTQHTDSAMRALIAARPWLRVFRLPPYAPELNPVEGIWAHLKKSLANLAAYGTDQLAGLVRTRLKRMQYRSGLLDGFVAETGLVLEPP